MFLRSEKIAKRAVPSPSVYALREGSSTFSTGVPYFSMVPIKTKKNDRIQQCGETCNR
jgi:hypothetical protein